MDKLDQRRLTEQGFLRRAQKAIDSQLAAYHSYTSQRQKKSFRRIQHGIVDNMLSPSRRRQNTSNSSSRRYSIHSIQQNISQAEKDMKEILSRTPTLSLLTPKREDSTSRSMDKSNRTLKSRLRIYTRSKPHIYNRSRSPQDSEDISRSRSRSALSSSQSGLRGSKIRQNSLNESKINLLKRVNPELAKDAPWKFLEQQAESITQGIINSDKKINKKEIVEEDSTPPPKLDVSKKFRFRRGFNSAMRQSSTNRAALNPKNHIQMQRRRSLLRPKSITGRTIIK